MSFLERGFPWKSNCQLASITNFVVVSSVGIKRFDCIYIYIYIYTL